MANADQDQFLALLQNAEFESQAIFDMLGALVEMPPMLGDELDETLADGVQLCKCEDCGHEHHKQA